MPNQVLSSVENNFTKGLITEFTGLNFPENAATDTDNCVYTLVGDVNRRLGVDYELNRSIHNISRNNGAVSTYKWNNAGGDGETQVVVSQVGSKLYFYKSSDATVSSPLSAQLLISIVTISDFTASGGVFDSTVECDYTDGNGYLFVYHPDCNPFYCTFNSGTITGTSINVKVRDFTGVLDPTVSSSTTRPSGLTDAHNYNLQNQGWVAGNAWSVESTSTNTISTSGSKTWTVPAGLSATNGDIVSIYFATFGQYQGVMSGTITSYAGTTMTLNIFDGNTILSGRSFDQWLLTPVSVPYVSAWFSVEGNYPSNSDVWWYFKNAAGAFDPTTMVPKVSVGSSSAPRGHFLLDAFDQQRSTVSSISGITQVTTTARPRTGTWFQGRIWYTGTDHSQVATGTADSYSWTENIYFSQIVKTPADFGLCYQINDPTSETLFDLLPTDGGVIQIQGCGAIYKLFPLQNALLVFAANGVWYLTGSQGIGFTANDYTIVKLSSVKSISTTSFVDINGLPMFWNEEGIYSVEPAKQGGGLLNSPLHVNPLEVNPLTVGTILTYYNSIPLQSKKYARGAYNPIDYVVQWCFKSTEETDVNSRYNFDKILNFNNSNKAFYPYSFTTSPSINGIVYVSSPGGSTAPNSVFKYLTSTPTTVTFSEEIDDSYVDWKSSDGVGTNFNSYFITGFKLHGQGQRRFQLPYLYVFSRGDTPTSYKIQGIWDYALTGDSGRWSVAQLINNWSPNFGMIFRRHKIRGQGLVLQIKVSSADGQPFDIMGWSSFETQNTGV